MGRKTLVALAITLVVSGMVCFFSYVYVSQTLLQKVLTAHETATYLNSQIAYLTDSTIPDLTGTLGRDNRDPLKVRDATASYLATNLDLNAMLGSVVGTWPMIYDAAIVDADGKAILHTNPNLVGKTVTNRPDFRMVQNAKFDRQLRLVYNPPTVYDVRMPLILNGKPFGDIRLGISTLFLRRDITPKLREAVIFSGVSILLSLLLAVGLSYIALGSAGTSQPPFGGDDELGVVTLKIAR